MKALHIAAAIMTALFLSLSAMGADFAKPDFAFPAKAGKQAETRLKKARRNGDTQLLLRSLMDLSIARSAVSSDNNSATIATITECLDEDGTPERKAMLNLLLATIYTQLYQENRIVYDQRNLPLTPLPDSYDQWSGRQFKARITALVDAALDNPAALLKSPLTKWKGVITQNRLTAIYYPTLFDFASLTATDLLSTVYRRGAPLPLRCLTLGGSDATSAPVKGDDGHILAIYDAWVNLNEGRSTPAFVNAGILRLRFISDHTDSSAEKTLSLYMKLADKLAGTEWAGDALIAADNFTVTENDKLRLWRRATKAIKDFPAYPRLNNLKDIVAGITKPQLTVAIDECVPPEVPVSINVKTANIASGHIDVYRVDINPTDNYFNFKRTSRYEKVTRIPVKAADSVPSWGEQTLSYTFPKSGRYVLVPVCGNSSTRDGGYQVISVTRLAIMSTSGSNPTVWAVNPADGSPVEGADIFLSSYRKTTGLGKTDSDGMKKITFKGDNLYGNVYAVKGADTSQTLWTRGDTDRRPDSTFTVNAYTALPLYHPGDTVEFCAFVVKTTLQGKGFASGRKLKATLLDANRQPVDTVETTTDRWGRINGRLTIPADRLQGSWSLRLNGDGISGNTYFTVSDYKLPTFNVELQQPLKLADGSFVIKGYARLYSGFPAANAPVSVAVSSSNRFSWWYNAHTEAFYTVDTTTDAEGMFSVTLTSKDLADSPTGGNYFSATATVSLTTGESREATIGFADGNFVKLMIDLPEAIDTSSPVALPVKAYNTAREEIKTDVRYNVSRGDSTLISASLAPGVTTADWSHLPSGPAKVTFSASGDTVICQTILYKPTDSISPSGEVLWTPTRTLTADHTGHAKLLLGVSEPTHLLYLLSSDTTVTERKWISLGAGMHNIDVKIPSGTNRADLSLAAMAGYRSSTLNIEVKGEPNSSPIALEIESFRDKLTPGNRETWKIHVKNSKGNGVQAAVLLDLWNKSLAQLAAPSFSFNTRNLSYYNYSPQLQCFRNGSVYTSANVTTGRFSGVAVPNPQLETWGRSLISESNRIYSRGGARIFHSLAAAPQNIEKEEVADCATVSNDLKMAAKITADSDVAVEETAADGGAIRQADSAGEKFSYRDSETPLALFEPALTTNADGTLDYSFTVPDANATWVLNALAVSDDIEVAGKELTAVASKPVMVQPSLPRFLRATDRLSIPALVINNSGEGGIVKTHVEFFSPLTGLVTYTRDFNHELAPGASATVSVDMTAPSDEPLIGYRIKATMGGFSDGEQNTVAVLPSTTRVIESKPFYMTPDSTVLDLDIPAPGNDANVTLTFCENPLWLAVSALPGLLEDTPLTAPEAASRIYSASVAAGILRGNPAIARALKEWSASPSDSTLVSMLERNSELKTLMLQATPWMAEAQSDTERMTRLSLLFDRDNIDAAVNTGIKTLAKLVDRGGMRWSEGSDRASQWATTRVLDLMGRLNSMGWLPDNAELRRQIDEAVKWLDAQVADDYRRNPGGNFTEYVSVRDRFPGIRQSSAAARATDATVQQLIGRWRDLDISAKARAAMVLESHNYHATAMQILTSLREFAMQSATKGMWWPRLTESYASGMTANSATASVLEAFATVDPKCDDIDRIRQWLILQKEAQNWGSGDDATTLVAAILATSTKWITPARGVTVSINGTELTVPETEKSLGSFTTDITSAVTAGGHLNIAKPGDAPSWGAVVSIFTDTITSVKAQGIEGLSINKRIYRLLPDGSAATASGPLELGTKVKVELLIKCDRALDYVAITDDRPACFEPVEQLPGYIWSEGIRFYRINADTSTTLLIDSLPKGTYLLNYEMWVTSEGLFTDGIATVQSQYAPALTAHSSGSRLNVVR